jgi:hypothetical protein
MQVARRRAATCIRSSALGEELTATDEQSLVGNLGDFHFQAPLQTSLLDALAACREGA